MKKNLFYFPLLLVFFVNAFGSFNIDSTSVKIVNLTDSIMITDYAKKFVDDNKISYQVIADLYNKTISGNSSELSDYYDNKHIVAGYQKYLGMELTIDIKKSTGIIKTVGLEDE